MVGVFSRFILFSSIEHIALTINEIDIFSLISFFFAHNWWSFDEEIAFKGLLTSWQRNGSNVDPFLNSYWSSSRWQGYREGYTSGWDLGEGVLWDAQWLGVEFWNVWCMHTYFRALKFQENMVCFSEFYGEQF